jgi:hypothetical protein
LEPNHLDMASYFDEHNCEALAEGEQPDHLAHFRQLLLDSGHGAEMDLEFARMFGDDKPPPASAKVINDLPDVEKVKPDEKCPICLVVMRHEEENRIKELPCNHQFHFKCILQWLKMVNTCPMCKLDLPTDDPR